MDEVFNDVLIYHWNIIRSNLFLYLLASYPMGTGAFFPRGKAVGE
jgi:hypothetical protein